MHWAHAWLLDHFDELESGAVVDVEYITGKAFAPKVSEAASEATVVDFDYERVRRPYCFCCGEPNPGGICQPPKLVRVGGVLDGDPEIAARLVAQYPITGRN